VGLLNGCGVGACIGKGVVGWFVGLVVGGKVGPWLVGLKVGESVGTGVGATVGIIH